MSTEKNPEVPFSTQKRLLGECLCAKEQNQIAKAGTPKPDWAENAPFRFTNEFGEILCARCVFDERPRVEITHSDVDWAVYELVLGNQVNDKVLWPIIMHESEQLFFQAVVFEFWSSCRMTNLRNEIKERK